MKHRARRLLAGALTLVILLSLTASAGVAGASGGRHREFVKVGYFVQWGIYGRELRRQGSGGQRVSGVAHAHQLCLRQRHGGRCLRFRRCGADYQVSFGADRGVDGVADEPGQPLYGNFNQLKKLKAKHPDLKVLISLGGWTLSKFFSDAVAHPQSWQAVRRVVHRPVHRRQPARPRPGAGAGVFDGIDLDWEWPGSEGNVGNVIRAEDKQNFTVLVAEFRRQLDVYGDGYELTAFLPAAPVKIDAGFEVDEIFDDLYFATVQGYDFHGTWETTTNHQGQLYSPRCDPDPARFSLDLAIDSYRQRGAPAHKLVVGVPYFGRGWEGVPLANNGLYQAGVGRLRGRGSQVWRTSRCWRRGTGATTVISSTAPTGSSTAPSGGATTIP